MSGQRGPQPPPGPRGGGPRTPAIVASADDREEMRALYHATGAAAFGLALRVLHRRGAAEDVVREGYRRARAAQWIFDEDDTGRETGSRAAESAGHTDSAALARPAPDLGTPWGRSAFVATEQRSDLAPHIAGAMDVTFGSGVVYTHDGSRSTVGGGSDSRAAGSEHLADHEGTDDTDHPDPQTVTLDQSWLLAQIHRLAVQRLRLDRRGDDMPWLAAAARLGFEDPLDSRCEIFVLAYYGGRTYRAIGRELGLRVPMVTRLLAEGIERLAEQRIDRWTAQQSWCPPGSVLSLADAYALDAVAEIEHHHIESKLTATTPNSLSQFAARVRGVHEVLAQLAADDQHTPPRNLETRILADLGTAPQRRGHWTARPPWLRRFGGQSTTT